MAVQLVKFKLPIAKERERVAFGFHRMHAESSGGPAIFTLLLAGIALVLAPGRWLAIRTSKVPKWPVEVR